MRWRRAGVRALAITVLLAGCSGSEGSPTTLSPSSSPATGQGATGSAIDRTFDVGPYVLNLRCEGSGSPGSPTILYLHGLGGTSRDVSSIAGPLTDRARVCAADRVNAGRSASDPGRHTGADSVRDLHTLLDAAAVTGPYLLLGFSFGGLLATMYAGTYPDQVMGILILDGSLPTDDEIDLLIPDDQRAGVMAEQESNPERVDFYRTLEEAKALVGTVPDVPVTFMAAQPVDLPATWPVEEMRQAILDKQTQFVATFPQGRLVQVDSSHDIDLDQPELVIQEVDRILSSS